MASDPELLQQLAADEPPQDQKLTLLRGLLDDGIKELLASVCDQKLLDQEIIDSSLSVNPLTFLATYLRANHPDRKAGLLESKHNAKAQLVYALL